MKRLDYITWDKFFMQCSESAALRSKDPNTRHGACIVKDNKILSTGYNGLVNGLNDDGLHIDSFSTNTPTTFIPKNGIIYDYWLPENKESWVIHAEANAILNSRVDISNSILYLHSDKNYLPCNNCAKMIVQSGIIGIVVKCLPIENSDKYNWDHTKHIFNLGGVSIRIMDSDK